MREKLELECRFADVSTDGVVSGYASVWGKEDIYKDVLLPTAFDKTLAEHRAAGTSPLMLWSHIPSEIIGTWKSITPDEKGLAVTGKIVASTRRGQEALDLLKEGAFNGLSIGFALRSAKKGPNGTRIISDLYLAEISLVGLPAASDARITSVRNASLSRQAFLTACNSTLNLLKG